jgi:hypothetical protein
MDTHTPNITATTNAAVPDIKADLTKWGYYPCSVIHHIIVTRLDTDFVTGKQYAETTCSTLHNHDAMKEMVYSMLNDRNSIWAEPYGSIAIMRHVTYCTPHGNDYTFTEWLDPKDPDKILYEHNTRPNCTIGRVNSKS